MALPKNTDYKVTWITPAANMLKLLPETAYKDGKVKLSTPNYRRREVLLSQTWRLSILPYHAILLLLKSKNPATRNNTAYPNEVHSTWVSFGLNGERLIA